MLYCLTKPYHLIFMKKMFCLTRSLWKWAEDGALPEGDVGEVFAFFGTFVTAPVDILLTLCGVYPYQWYKHTKATRKLFAGSHRKTRLEPYHVPRHLAAKFDDTLLELLCKEFVEDQLCRDLENDDSCAEELFLIDYKSKKSKTHVHLKFTRKTFSGRGDTFDAVHYFLALTMSTEDRVVHIDRVHALQNSHHADDDGREAEFKAFIVETSHNPFELQVDPMSAVRKRRLKKKPHQEETPTSETPGAINPVSE
jgi:hypothetical protein